MNGITRDAGMTAGRRDGAGPVAWKGHTMSADTATSLDTMVVRAAEAAVDHYLDHVDLAEAAPHAVMIKVFYLKADQRRGDADELLQRARAANPDVDWESLGGGQDAE